MRFWIDDLRNPREYIQDWGKDDDIWSKSLEEFMMHMQIHVQGDQRIGHIYFDYNLGIRDRIGLCHVGPIGRLGMGRGWALKLALSFLRSLWPGKNPCSDGC